MFAKFVSNWLPHLLTHIRLHTEKHSMYVKPGGFLRFMVNGISLMLISNSFDIQWGKKVFSQPPILQVLPLKKMREACNFHHWYTSTMTDTKSHCRIFNEFICKLWWKINIWSPTNKQDFWLSQTCNFFFKRLLCPPLVTCINGTCLNLLSV